MKERFLLVSLPNDDSYQRCQAVSAKAAAQQCGASVRVVYADNDPVTQSQQVLEIVQSRSGSKPDAVILEPLTTTGLGRVAESAIQAGIAWVVLNSEVDYLGRLRKLSGLPIFGVSVDQREIGRVQGRQFATLLPEGGNMLYIQGPATNSAAMQRTEGLLSTKPENIQLTFLRSKWSESDAYKVVSAWLRLSTNLTRSIDLVGCQDDAIAKGARRAFAELSNEREQTGWMSLPFTGVDGLPDEGRAWVRDGTLRATVATTVTTQVAIELLMSGLRTGVQPAERTLMDPESYPSIEQLSVPQRHSPSHRPKSF